MQLAIKLSIAEEAKQQISRRYELQPAQHSSLSNTGEALADKAIIDPTEAQQAINHPYESDFSDYQEEDEYGYKLANGLNATVPAVTKGQKTVSAMLLHRNDTLVSYVDP